MLSTNQRHKDRWEVEGNPRGKALCFSFSATMGHVLSLLLELFTHTVCASGDRRTISHPVSELLILSYRASRYFNG